MFSLTNVTLVVQENESRREQEKRRKQQEEEKKLRGDTKISESDSVIPP